jgi:hypothetical protein
MLFTFLVHDEKPLIGYFPPHLRTEESRQGTQYHVCFQYNTDTNLQNPCLGIDIMSAAGGTVLTSWVEPQKVDYSAYTGDDSQTLNEYDGAAPIYQWSDEFGDVGPKFEALELELFGDPQTRHDRAGLDFSK